MRTDWYWVRQGATSQDAGRYEGRLDLPSVPPDAAVARRLSSRLPRGAVWLTSPLGRARASVAAMDASANAVSVEEMTDQDLGSWTGRRRAEVHKANPQIDWSAPALVEPEGGEGFSEVVDRAAKLIERLTGHYSGRPLVAVSHSAVIRAAIVLALDLPNEAGYLIDVAPFSLTHLSWTGPDDFSGQSDERVGTWRVHTLNLTVS